MRDAADEAGRLLDPARITYESTVGPVDSSQRPRFAGPATFALLPRLDEVKRADIVVAGAPFDGGVSYRSGARFGPAHVREASRLLRPYHPPTATEPFRRAQVADAGDMTINPFSIEDAVDQVETAARSLTQDGARLVTIGGDHTIALPLLRAAAKVHGPLAVVHFDAHLDTWDTYFGAPITHGTPFRRASEEGLLDLDRCMHVGVRGPLYGPADLVEDRNLGFQIITCDEIETEGLPAAIDRLLMRIGDRPLYVSVDIDVLDPSHAPGTGTPEAGGLTSRELLHLLRSLPGDRLVGADVVEVSPAYDHAQLTAVAASHVLYELICIMSAGLRK